MAALSFSPSPPSPTPTNASQNAGSTSGGGGGGGKENGGTSKHHQQSAIVTPLRANAGGGGGVGGKSFAKITVHNVLSESGANSLQQHIANQNTIIRKIKDFGMLGAVHSAAAVATTTTINTTVSSIAQAGVRKRPLGEQNTNSKASSQVAGKRNKLTKKTQNKERISQSTATATATATATGTVKPLANLLAMGTPGRKGLPLPQAVARRNARERNRVKQVNNGFAALRERIPEEVSEAFEAQGAGRGASKKLSKVETLRMAVEYIRSLERLLGFDFPPIGGGFHSNSGSSSGDDSFMFIKDEFDNLDEQFDDSMSNYEMDEPTIAAATPADSSTVDLLLPNLTTLNGLQYVRIPGTNTYQLLTPSDSQSLVEALIDTNCLPNVAAAGAAAIAAGNERNNNNETNGECVKFNSTLSRSPVPGATSPCTSPTIQMQQCSSSSSLHQPPTAATVSPVAVANELLLQACAAQQQQQQQLIKQEYTSNTLSNHQQQQQQQQHDLLCSPILPAFYDQEPVVSFYDNVVASLPSFKKEFNDMLQHDQTNNATTATTAAATATAGGGGCLSDESMIDAIDWWEAHTPKSDGEATNQGATTSTPTSSSSSGAQVLM